jgi:hypothetical protein
VHPGSRDLIRDSADPLHGVECKHGVACSPVGRDHKEDTTVIGNADSVHRDGSTESVPGHVREPGGLFVLNEMPAMDREAASVAPCEEFLSKRRRQSILSHEGIKYEPPKRLREELLVPIVIKWHRDEFTPGQEKAIGHEAVDVGIPATAVTRP